MFVLLAGTFVSTMLFLPALIKMLAPIHSICNYRQMTIPGAVGMVFVLIPAPFVVYGMLGWNLGDAFSWALLVVAMFFAFLGLVDDLLGDQRPKGFSGHGKAFLEGQLTTGMLKAVLGGIMALAIADWSVLDGLFIALTANLFNLFDVQPARTIKVFLVVTPLLMIATGVPFPINIWLACALAYLPVDAGERAVMGDVGANTLGAICGVQATLLSPLIKWILLGVVVGLTVIAQIYSLSAIIERSRFFRWLDGLFRAK